MYQIVSVEEVGEEEEDGHDIGSIVSSIEGEAFRAITTQCSRSSDRHIVAYLLIMTGDWMDGWTEAEERGCLSPVFAV